ncbi:glycosyltransferase family 48 protein, partial [Athelia psychrophila]
MNPPKIVGRRGTIGAVNGDRDRKPFPLAIPIAMAARAPGGPRTQESYSASSFSSHQQQYAYSSSTGLRQQPRGYYDGETESQDYRDTRDTYTSESSQGPHDDDGYYDDEPYNQPENESDRDAYGNQYAPSAESHAPSRTG